MENRDVDKALDRNDTGESATDAVGLLPLMVMLWLGYLLALLLIDHLFYRVPIFSPTYYLISASSALLVLGLALYVQAKDRQSEKAAPLASQPWGERLASPASPSSASPRIGGRGADSLLSRALLPTAIVLLSVMSIALAELTGAGQMPGPANSPESMLLRTMPLLLLALILTAWQYGWPYVVLYSGGVALFSTGLYWWLGQDGRPFGPPMTLVMIQTISFLVVGYFISALIKRLKEQQASLARANAQLVHYAATMEDLTISRERNRLARELHDTLAHTLSALSVQLETVKAYWDVDPAAAKQMLDRSLDATRSGLQETRRALKSLRASPLDDLGLILALRRMSEETARRANLALDLSLPSNSLLLPDGVEQTIYRIAQEALANVAHHANAHTLQVQLSTNPATGSAQSGNGLSLIVQDDGLGFDPQQAQTAGHFGLPGMDERAALVGGNLTVSSQPGQGTTVRLLLKDVAMQPLTE